MDVRLDWIFTKCSLFFLLFLLALAVTASHCCLKLHKHWHDVSKKISGSILDTSADWISADWWSADWWWQKFLGVMPGLFFYNLTQNWAFSKLKRILPKLSNGILKRGLLRNKAQGVGNNGEKVENNIRGFSLPKDYLRMRTLRHGKKPWSLFIFLWITKICLCS